jgi:hypothetical protein
MHLIKELTLKISISDNAEVGNPQVSAIFELGDKQIHWVHTCVADYTNDRFLFEVAVAAMERELFGYSGRDDPCL